MRYPDSRPRRFLALAFAAGAVIVLAVGSIVVCVAVLAAQPHIYDVATQQVEAAGYAVRLVLPAALVVFWVFGTIALIAARQQNMLLWLLLACLLGVGCAALVPIIGQPLPARGFAAVLIILLFVAVNAGALYSMLRYVLRT
jgi:hypothetical protein